MSDNIIDLTARRNAAAQPDPEFVKHDEYGRPLYTFLVDYVMGEKNIGAQIWAYDHADAEARVAAMRESLTVSGQLFAVIPA